MKILSYMLSLVFLLKLKDLSQLIQIVTEASIERSSSFLSVPLILRVLISF